MHRIAVLVLVVFLAALGVWRSSVRTPAIDYYQYWTIADAMHGGEGGRVYAAEARGRLGQKYLRESETSGSPRQREVARMRSEELQAASTPFLFTMFGLFRTGDYDRDLDRHRLVLLLAIAGTVILSARAFGASWTFALIALALIYAFYPPVRQDVRDGNVNSIQVLLIALSVYLLRRPSPPDLLIGLLLALGAVFKPNTALTPIVLLAGLLFAADHARALRMGGGIALGLGVGFLSAAVFGGGGAVWTEWFTLIPKLEQEMDVGLRWGNVAPAQLIREGTGWIITPAISLLGALGFLVIAFLNRGAERYRRDSYLLLASLLVPLLCGSLTWTHYFMLLVPLVIAVSLAEGMRISAQILFVAAVVSLTGTSALIQFGVTDPAVLGWITVGGLVALFLASTNIPGEPAHAER